MLRQWIKVHYVIILFCCIRKSIPVRHRAVYLRHIILCVYIIYLMWYIYIIIIYSLRRRVFVSVVRMRSYQYYIFCIIVSWLPTHTHTAYTYLLYEPSNTYCVYRTDMITYYYYCHRVYDEQRVAKTTVAPRTRRIKESCTRNPSKRAHRRNYNPEKEKEYGHRRYCYSGG